MRKINKAKIGDMVMVILNPGGAIAGALYMIVDYYDIETDSTKTYYTIMLNRDRKIDLQEEEIKEFITYETDEENSPVKRYFNFITSPNGWENFHFTDQWKNL